MCRYRGNVVIAGVNLWKLVMATAVVVAGLGYARGTLAGTPVSWEGGTGLWSNPTKWDLGLAPNNGAQTYDVLIGSAGDDVTLDMSATVDTLSNAGLLRFAIGQSLTLAQPAGLTNTGQLLVNHAGISGLFGAVNNSGFVGIQSGTLQLNQNVQNSGTVWLGSPSFGGSNASLQILSNVALNGPGEIYILPANVGATQLPSIQVGLGAVLTNGPGHRIHGAAGSIQGQGRLVNQGLIDADVPIRTMTISVAEFVNQGNLFARSGNLNVTTPSWHNSGTVRVANGSNSVFTGTLLTNDSTGRVESLGASTLTLNQNVNNYGLFATGGTGKITFGGGYNTLVTNLPTGIINAIAGTVRFQSQEGYIQNFGTIGARQGKVEFANGTDVFGGILNLTSASSATVTAGTSNLTQVRTTIDATSSMGVSDQGTGATTLNVNGNLENSGMLYTRSDPGNTATFNLSGTIIDHGGTIRSDGGDFNISNSYFQESGTLQLDLRNGGDVRFTNIDSTVEQMTVGWTGTGGQLLFDNYRNVGPTTVLNLSGFTAQGANLTVANGSILTATGFNALSANSTLQVSGTNAWLSAPTLSQTAAGSLVDLFSGGRLTANNLAVSGAFRFRGATLEGNLTLNPSATFTVESGTNVVTGNLGWSGDRTVTITGGDTNLTVNGNLNIASGSGIMIPAYSTNSGMRGTGTVTNSGLIEGMPQYTGWYTFWDIDLVNQAGGVVRSRRYDPGVTGTNFSLRSDITNAGLMEADAATMTFDNATVINSGHLQAINNGALSFINGTDVTSPLRGTAGTMSADGDTSLVNVVSAANVSVGSLTLDNGADLIVTGPSSVLNIASDLTIGGTSVATISNFGRLESTGVRVDNRMTVDYATVAAPLTIGSTGEVTSTYQSPSYWANFDGPVMVENGGKLSMYNYYAGVGGTGTITNEGLIQGLASVSGYPTYLHSNVNNMADGVIRAGQNVNGATNTYLDVYGDITNAGIMEADGGRLSLVGGSTIANSGLIRAINNSTVTFSNSLIVTDSGGSGLVDGNMSFMDVAAASNVAFSALSLANGGDLRVTGPSSVLNVGSPFTVGADSVVTVSNYGRLQGAGVRVDHQMIIDNATVAMPLTIGSTGEVISTASSSSYPARFENPVTIENGGKLSMYNYYTTVGGPGLITNHGLIQGGAQYSSYPTYLYSDVANAADGVIRARMHDNGATNTWLEVYGDITNEGTMEADGGRLQFMSGSTVINSGTLQALNNSEIRFQSGARVTDMGGSLSLRNNGIGNITDNGTMVNATTEVEAGSTLYVSNSAVLGGPSAQIDGQMYVYNATVTAPVTIGATGEVISTYQSSANPARFDGSMTIESGGRLSMYNYYSAVAGAGLITNSGTIQGLSSSGGSPTYLYSNVTNTSDGTIRAGRNANGATGTWLEIYSDIDNAGTIEADGGRLQFMSGSSVINGGTLRAINNSEIRFQSGAVVTHNGGSLTLTSGGIGNILNNGTNVATSVQVDDGSILYLQDYAVLAGPGVRIDGEMQISNATVSAPLTIGAMGEAISTYQSSAYPARFNGPVTIENGGKLSMYNYYTAVAGTGTITNHGLVQGASTLSGYQTYLYSNITNASDGTIRAAQNANGATNTYLEIYSDIDNAGIIEANGGRLQFMSGSSVINGGTLRAVNNSEIRFQNGAVVTDNGGSLSLNTGGVGNITDSGTNVSTSVQVDDGSTLYLSNSAVLGGPGARIDGDMYIYNATVSAPLTIGATGEVISTYQSYSNPARLDGPVMIENGGTLSLYNYYSAVAGAGTITNHGLIQGRASSSNLPTYLLSPITNAADGVVRAGQHINGSTGTWLEVYSQVNNAGVMEADGGRLNFMPGSNVTNSGMLRAINNSEIRFQGGARVTDAGGLLTLSSGGVGNIYNNGTNVATAVQVDDGSLLYLSDYAVLGGPGVRIDGEMQISNATLTAPLTIGGMGEVRSTYGSSGYPARLEAAVAIENGGMFTMYANDATYTGAGAITNHGLILGAAFNDGYQTRLYNNLFNESDGVVRAGRNPTSMANNTRLEIYGDVVNDGVMESDGGQLTFMAGSNTTNSGTLQAINGSGIRFQNGAVVADAGGTLSLSSTGTGVITDVGTSVSAQTNIAEGSTLYLNSGATLGGPGAQVDGAMAIYDAYVTAPVTIGSTGEVTTTYQSPSYPARLNNSVMVESGGKLSLYAPSSAYSGSGIITNHGLIQGAAWSNNNPTYLYSQITNASDGVVRAAQNPNGATGTWLEVRSVVDNAGLMEANGGALVFTTGATVNNSGTLAGTNGSRIWFQGGARVNDAGGTLSLHDTGYGTITDGTTVVNTAVDIENGSALTLTNSATLGGPGVQVDGQFYIQNNARVNAPVNVGLTGQVIADSWYNSVYFNEDITIAGDGVDSGRLSLRGNALTMSGLGGIINNGIVEGGAPNSGNATYLYNPITNNADGTVRAYSNNGATGTVFELRGTVTNQGMLEADNATLSLTNIYVDNTGGSWSAVNGGRLYVSGSFVGGASGSTTTIDGDLSRLELVNGSLVGLDFLNLTNGGDASVSGTNTTLAILSAFDIGPGSVATIAGNGRLQSGAVTVDGMISGQGGTLVSDAVHLNATGSIEATTGTTTLTGNVTTTAGSLISVTTASTNLVIDGTLDNVLGSTVRLNTYSTSLSGAGLFTNAGLLEGGGWGDNNTTTMAKSLVNSGQVVATSASGSLNTTFQLTSPTVVNSGTFTATGAHLLFTNSRVDHSGTMRAENGFALSFQGSTVVNNLGGGVEIDGDASRLQVFGPASVSVASLSLANGADATVSGGTLNVATGYAVNANSILTVNNGGVLAGGAILVNNLMNAGQATISAPVTISPTGRLDITSSSPATFNAPVTVQTDGANDGRITLYGNYHIMNGTGTITNSGLIEGAAPNNTYSTYIDNPIINTADGTIRAAKNGAAVDTYLQLRGSITNSGLMEANGANLYFPSSTVFNSGTIRAVDHANGSRLYFLNSAQVSDVGGTSVGELNGAMSYLQVSANADVAFNTLSLTGGATGYVTDGGSTLVADMTIGAGSTLTVNNGGQLGGAGIRVDGTLNVGSAVVTAPTTVGAGGTLTTLSSSAATFNAPITIEAGGTDGQLTLTGDWHWMNGSGTVTNHGLIRGAPPSSGVSTYIDTPMINAADGEIRAAQNGSATNTYLQLRNSVTNSGLMTANGANLYFTTGGASVANSGTIRAVSHPAGSRLIFLNNTQVANTGGTGMAEVDGATSTIEVSNNADVVFSSLVLTNGATGSVNGSDSTVTANLSIGSGSSFSVLNGARLSGAGLTINGLLNMSNSLLDINGAWTAGASGRLQTSAGGVIQLSGDFVNASTQRNDFALNNIILNLDASNNSGTPLMFEVAGQDLGNVAAGFTNNFAVATLLISGADEYIELADDYNNPGDGLPDALYVTTLTCTDPDSRLMLNGFNLYYTNLNCNPDQIVTLRGGAAIQVVPEPATLLLVAVGGVVVIGRRRRRGI